MTTQGITNRILRTTALVFAVTLVSTGCITSMKSKPLNVETGGTSGFEYALPVPLIEVIPKPDGTLEVGVKYVADPSHRYFIASTSIFSSETLTVETESGGLLKKVVFDGKSGDVPSEAIKAAGEVKKAELTAKATADKAAQTAADAANTALAEAEAKLTAAKAKLTRLEELKKAGFPVEAKDLLAAELAIVDAQVTRDAAAAVVEKSSVVGSKGNSAQDSGKPEESSKFPKAWGPVYYQVQQTWDKTNKKPVLKLIPARFTSSAGDQTGQLRFDTSEIAKPDPKPPTFTIKGSNVLKLLSTGQYQLTVEVADGPAKVTSLTVTNVATGKTFDKRPSNSPQKDGSFIASFDTPRGVGEYSLDIGFVYGKQKSPDKAAVFFQIE